MLKEVQFVSSEVSYYFCLKFPSDTYVVLRLELSRDLRAGISSPDLARIRAGLRALTTRSQKLPGLAARSGADPCLQHC